MNDVQLMLFPQATAEVDAAIATIGAQRLPLPNHLHFVGELCASMTSLPAGSVILAAAPGGSTSDEVCSWVKEYFQNASSAKTGERPAQLAVINTPMAENLRLQRKFLLDAYRGALPLSRIKHVHEPQFQLEFGQSFLSNDPFQVVSGLIAARAIDYYILRDAHNLQRPGVSMWDARDQVRYLIQLAQNSGRTHVLLGRLRTVWQWLKDPQIAEALTPCLLHPYDVAKDDEAATFMRLLLTFDGVVPWKKGHNLAEHFSEINEVVHGSPQRLKKWVLNALTGAKAKGLQAITWDFFCERKPTASESLEAAAEFKISQNFLRRQGTTSGADTDTGDAPAPVVKPVRKTKPGRSKPKRYTVGQDAA